MTPNRINGVLFLISIVCTALIYGYYNFEAIETYVIGGLFSTAFVILCGLILWGADIDFNKLALWFTRTPQPGWIYSEILTPRANPFEERDGGIREFSSAVVVEVLKGYIKFRITHQLHLPVMTTEFISPLSEFHKKWRRDKTSKMISDTSYNPPRDMIVDINYTHTIHYIQK